MHESYRNVSLTDLLSMQSGLPPNPTITFNDATERQQRVSFAKWVLRQPPVSPKGTFAYANSNYILAGAIMERVADQDFTTLISENLFRLLSMNVGFGSAGTAGMTDQPWGHRVRADSTLVPIPPGVFGDNPPVYGPAGRAHLSMRDWARWAQAALRAASGLSSPWSAATARELFEPRVSTGPGGDYAFGWIVTRRPWAQPGGRVLAHSGSNTLHFAVVWLAPEAGFGVLVATNQGGPGAALATDAVAGKLIQWYLGRAGGAN